MHRSSGPTCAKRCPIDKEIETIIFKAFAKELDRRYQSAGELAADVRHYLAGEAIVAKRDSGWYVLRKTVHRYRAVAVSAAATYTQRSWRTLPR
jgi:hypothetical protein